MSKGRSKDLVARTIDLSKKVVHTFKAFQRIARTLKPDLIYLWMRRAHSCALMLQL